ncbi:MAG: excisionase family DNA-binding protein [Planctomycetes bacterium]|nr:excisionase family DNA-binding protein [Planctomycetota bacterium]
MLSISLQTLDAYIRSGELPSLRLGRRRLIRLEALHDFAKLREEAWAVEAGHVVNGEPPIQLGARR